MAEDFQYCELWDGLECDGGDILGRFVPIAPRRRRRLTGDDAFSFVLPSSHRLVASLSRGAVVREVLSLDGTVVREWPIERVSRGTGHDVLVAVECLGVMTLLTHYPVQTTDADGFVYRDTPAVQLPPAQIIDDFLLSTTPSWLTAGTATPTDLAEVAFAGDNARSGARRLEEAVPGYEASLRRNGSAGYELDYTVLGGSADTLYLRPGKQVRTLRQEVVPGQVNRVNQIEGATGDDGPSGIAWAYWEVESITGSGPYRVKLKAIHGGPGPVAFDDQFNHANLPGGANSLYLECRDGTTQQITDSRPDPDQDVEVADVSAISVGDWVRFAASSTGQHLTFLDAPAEIAAHGLASGRYESAWDDAVCVLKNALQSAWSGTRPDDWTGSFGSKTTAAGDWLTAGQALDINTTVGATVICAPPARSWYISARRTTWTAVAWIRLRGSLGTRHLEFRVKVGSTVIGEPLIYRSPLNQWRQLKIEGLDLSAYAGTTVSLTAELAQVGGSGTVNLIVDSICLFPALSARPVTLGSNAARTWQGINAFLDVRRAVQTSYRATIADLARMGLPAQAEPALGGAAVIADEDLGTVSTRIHEIEDVPGDPAEAVLTMATLPPRLTRQPSKPAELIIPYFEPIHVRVAERAKRQAALRIKATITSQTATTITVTLDVQDTLGGVPTVTYAAFGATYSSGSGTGPYVFTKPTATNGVGRVVFTASLQGRTDVTDAVDVPEQTPTGPELVVTADPGATSYNIHYSAASGTTLQYSIDNGSFTSLGASPLAVARNAAGGDDKVVTVRGTRQGMAQTVAVTVPAQDAGGSVPASIDAFYATGGQDNAADTFPLAWTVSNAPGGHTFDIAWDHNGSWRTAGGVWSNTGASPKSFDADARGSADLVAKGTSGYETITYSLQLRLKSGSTILATKDIQVTVFAKEAPP